MTGGPSTFDQGPRGVARCLPAPSNPPGYGAVGRAPAGRRSRFRLGGKTIGFRESVPCAPDFSATRLPQRGGIPPETLAIARPRFTRGLFPARLPSFPPHAPPVTGVGLSPYVAANFLFTTLWGRCPSARLRAGTLLVSGERAAAVRPPFWGSFHAALAFLSAQRASLTLPFSPHLLSVSLRRSVVPGAYGVQLSAFPPLFSGRPSAVGGAIFLCVLGVFQLFLSSQAK